MEGDEAFYYLHKDGELVGGVITHVDNFTFASMVGFIQVILKTVSNL